MSRLSEQCRLNKLQSKKEKYRLSDEDYCLLLLIDVDASKIKDDFSLQVEKSLYKLRGDGK